MQNYAVLSRHLSIPRKPFNVVSTLLLGWYDVPTSDNVKINVEAKLCMSTLKFTMLNNAKSTLSISTLIKTTVETMLLFSTLSFTTLINVETTLWIWPFPKSWKEQKSIFELRKKITHLINNTCFWLYQLKRKRNM